MNTAVLNEKSELRLGDAAPACVWKIPIQQVASGERAERRHQDAPPAGTSWRIHAHCEPPGEQYESYDNKSDERADHEAEDQRKLVLIAAQPLFHPSFDQRFAGSLAGDLIQIITIISTTFVGVHPRLSDDDAPPTHEVTRCGRLGCRFES